MTRAPAAPPLSFEMRLPPEPRCVSAARQAVRSLLQEADRPDLVDPALLVVSELVTNALLHAGTEIDLAGLVDQHGLMVEIRDGSTHLPSRRNYATTAGTGRGLLMLEAIVDDWGATRHADGKTVWFRLSEAGAVLGPPTRAVSEAADATQAGDAGRAEGVGAGVPVQLQNMPLLLHAAWQEHAEALLREYLLASLDEGGTESIQMHADAIDAIAVLEEHVPRAPVELATDRLLDDAVEPAVSAERVEVPVPLESVPHFETLDRAIQAALDLSREGLVVAAPTQPEVSVFRRWLVRQVLRQADGAAPEPWTTPADSDNDVELPAGFDASAVTGAAHSVIAADQVSRVLAVSGPAARLLGHDDPADLVGQPLVAIIPERFRQAHLAGMAMYLLVGRRPILDHTVVLPVLRRDGTEVPVSLSVSEQPVGEGRHVLLARLDPTS